VPPKHAPAWSPRRTPGVAPRPARPRHNPLRVDSFNQLHHFGWISDLRFTDQEMEVIGHYHVAKDYETRALAHFFQDG